MRLSKQLLSPINCLNPQRVWRDVVLLCKDIMGDVHQESIVVAAALQALEVGVNPTRGSIAKGPCQLGLPTQTVSKFFCPAHALGSRRNQAHTSWGAAVVPSLSARDARDKTAAMQYKSMVQSMKDRGQRTGADYATLRPPLGKLLKAR